ncbi:MAG: LysE family translocator [Micromonosporaceae bacterium]
MSLAFVITTLIVVATPGTGVIYTLSASLSGDRRASLAAATGCTLGIVPHMLATITGLAALLHASAVAFQIVKYAGVAYLLYMAWMTVRDTGTIEVEAPAAPRSMTRVIVSGILVNLLNPKLTMFFLAFLPQFVDPANPTAMLSLSAVFMLVTFVVFALYGMFASAVRHQITSRPRVLTWLRRTFAACFVALSARLAFLN